MQNAILSKRGGSKAAEKDARNGSNPAFRVTVVKPSSPSMEKGWFT